MQVNKSLLLILLVTLSTALAAGAEDLDEMPDWRSDWEESGYFELCDVRDDTLIIFDGVTALGDASTLHWDPDLEDWVEVEPKFEDGPRFVNDYDGGDFTRVSLPSTLQNLGMEAFSFYHFTEFTLPVQLRVIEDSAFHACSFDTLRIETALPAADILSGLDSCTVNAYDAPADHPLYKTVDGVLFSRDGKTLLIYPNGRQDTHYDVPAGVERIGASAFSNEFLQTISLPIGLRSISNYGFAGCTRLQAIALPLTVRELGKDIFNSCVSLELVSLPDGLDMTKNANWAEYYADDQIFRGDNGDTLFDSPEKQSMEQKGKMP